MPSPCQHQPLRPYVVSAQWLSLTSVWAGHVALPCPGPDACPSVPPSLRFQEQGQREGAHLGGTAPSTGAERAGTLPGGGRHTTSSGTTQ